MSVYFDAAGDLYEGTDAGTVTLTNGSGTTTIASGLNNPVPLALNSQGELYVWSTGPNGEVYLLTTGGQLTPVVSVGPAFSVAVDVPEPTLLLGVAAPLILLLRQRRHPKHVPRKL